MIESEQPLPRCGLGGSFVGERWRAGEGWDLCATVHSPDGSDSELTVMVMRRTTGRVGRHGPRVPISSNLVAHTVAFAVVMTPLNEVPQGVDTNSLVDELNTFSRQVAAADCAWAAREMTIDGEVVPAREWEYAGVWARYHSTDDLMIFVIGSTELRLDTVELIKLAPRDVGPSRHVED